MQSAIKQELLKKIEATDDENLLQLLSTDYDYFTGTGDITDGLSTNELIELQNLVSEPDEKNTLTWDEYKQATATWRKK
jgi:hypothetical protein